ncbi:MAG: hypothetical protein ACRC1K_10220, partial [Planctomycetia bacterium]
EAYVSPSELPYSAKAGVAVGTGLLLVGYLALGRFVDLDDDDEAGGDPKNDAAPVDERDGGPS